MRSSRKPNSRSWLHRDLRRRQHSAYDLGHGSDRASGAINIRREKLMESINLQDFEKLGPFEIKDELIKLAKKTSRTTQSAFLNAGRGNPNWIATKPREGFFLLGQFAIKRFGFEPDAFVHELVDSIIGDNYPVPDRMLVHNERIVHEYLMWAMCG